jgi:hypothetical protein
MASKQQRFRVRLESPDLTRDDGSPHFRVTTLLAADDVEARRQCERRELRIAAHEYPPDVLADLEEQEKRALDAGVVVPAQVRMQLASHRQEAPYEVVSVEEVST